MRCRRHPLEPDVEAPFSNLFDIDVISGVMERGRLAVLSGSVSLSQPMYISERTEHLYRSEGHNSDKEEEAGRRESLTKRHSSVGAEYAR